MKTIINVFCGIAVASAMTGLILGTLPMSAGLYGWATVLLFVAPTVCLFVIAGLFGLSKS